MFQKQTFGSTNTGFGSFNAGASTSSPFSGFKPATGATGFGAPPAFGANATPQPAAGGGLFGSTNTTSGLFGGNTATSTGFGATSGFGFGATPASGGLFNNSSSGLFGNNQNNSAFGAKPATGNNAAGFGFGATANTSTTGGLFGSTPSTSTGLFGQQNNSMGGGLFGNTSGGFGQQQATGTAVVKYNPVAGTDVVVKAGTSTNVNIKHHCITCMKEYESKSLEELRLDDYVAGRKGPSGVFGFQQTENKPLFGGTSTFGQPATTSAPSLFGSSISSTPAFGQTNTFSFGGGTQTNTQTMGLFGANKPAFGATPTPGTGLFAATTTQAPAFGTNTTTFGFGANTQNQTGGLFNNKPATSGFGTTPSTGFGGFGAGLFAKTNTTAPTFGTTTPAFGTTGFGTNTTGSNLFGNNTFGKPATSQPSFGFNTQPALGTGLGTGLGTSFQPKPTNPGFGTLGTTGSLFQQPAQNTFRTGLDSSLGGGLFNNNSSLGGTLGMGATNNSTLTGAPPGGVHAQILSLVARPYGDSGLYKDLLPDAPTTSDEVLKPTNPSAVKAVLDSYRVSPATRLKLTVRPVPHKHDKKSLFDGLEESDASLEDKLTLKPSRKRLVLRNREQETTHDTQRSLEESRHNGSTDNREEVTDNDCSNRPVNNDTNPEISSDRHGSWLGSPKNSWKENEKPIDNESTPRLYPNLDKELPPQVSERRSSWLCSAALRPADTHRDADHTLRDLTQRTVSEEVPVQPHPAGVKLTRPGYYTIPSLDEMIGYLRADGSCVLPHFTVGRRNYGNVFYDEEIDVAGLDLDALVHFLNKEVIIYPEDGVKPPVGSGLNRRAVVTLERVWPRDKTERRPVTEPDRLLKMDYEGKLRRVCDKHDTKFIEYRPQTGSWVFRVEHFSKYGLTDSDEEDDITPDVLKRQLVDQGIQKSAPPQKPVPVSTSGQPVGPGLGGLGHSPTGPGLGGLGLSPSGPGLGGLGLSPGPGLTSLNMTMGLTTTDLVSDDYMQQTSLNLMNGASKGFGMDITDDHIEGDTLYQDGGLGVKSPTSELARLEHRQSHHVQLMKASLYADTEMLDDISVSTGDQLVPRASEETLPRVESVLEVIQTTAAEKVPEVSLRPLIVHPHTIVLKYNRKIPPFKKTIAGGLSAQCPCELSVSRARHSRVSMRPGSLVYLTTEQALRNLPLVNDLSNLSLYVGGRTDDDWSEASVVRLAIGQLQSNVAMETLSRQLTSLLEFSDTDTSRPVCPRLVVRNSPTDRHNLLLRLLEDAKHAADYKPSFGVSGAYCLQVWRLCEALWGHDLEHGGVPGTDEHSVVLQHKRLVQWLKDAVSETTDKELSQSETSPSIDESDLHSSKVWTLLMGGRVMEACKLSKESGDLNMAAIIAQATGDPSFKSLLCRQLRVWRECGAEALVADVRLASLTLVAGLRPRGGFEKVDWIRTLLAVTCYISPQIPSLEQVIRTYESYLTDDEMSVQHPRPPYMDRYDVSVDNRPSPVRDLRYELLSSRASHVRPRVHTSSYTPDPFDCTLSFLLSAWWGAPDAACVRDLANLLEAHGDWHEALHVLLHHPDDHARGHLIREVLNRNAPSKADTPELKERLEFVRRLQIPEKWLLMAQAYRAKYEHKPLLEVDHLVGAQQWDEAHRVLVDELLPDAVLSDKLSCVCGAVRALGGAADAHALRGWAGPGEALQHYTTLCEEIRAVVGGAGAGVCDRLRALRPSLAAACRALALFEPTTPRQAAARAEMGARLVQLAMAGGEPPPHLAALLRTLRLPPDCAAGAAYKITTDLAEQASELCLDSTPNSPISSHHRAIVNS